MPHHSWGDVPSNLGEDSKFSVLFALKAYETSVSCKSAWAGTEELRDREQLQEGEGVSGDVLQWEMEGISWPFPCPQNQKLLRVPHVQFQVLSMGVGKLNQELAGWQKHE